MMFFPWIFPLIMILIPFLLFAFVSWLIIRAATSPFRRKAEVQRSDQRFEGIKSEMESLKKEIEELKHLTAELTILIHDHLR
ncbi:TPA: hypothetical protein EYP37_01840 [Candidatus Poribacteria bacterium]|nr:hypothetical protein [Candidatus Poribacteria bacterium]